MDDALCDLLPGAMVACPRLVAVSTAIHASPLPDALGFSGAAHLWFPATVRWPEPPVDEVVAAAAGAAMP